MIIKETDPKNSIDKLINAGYKAETKMAHYLQRAFGQSDKVFVINDLRIEDDQKKDVAQIDHLVIHETGFIIIESKSVSTKVVVNSHGEWIRIFNNQEKGMPSPVQQAKRQAEFLKTFLNEHGLHLFRNTFLNKLTKLSYDDLFFDVLVAISDDGIIDRRNIDLPEVNKADTIPDKIEEIISKRKKDMLKEIIPKHIQLHKDTEKKIAYFLAERHAPKKQSTYTIPTESSTNSRIEEAIPQYNKPVSSAYCCKKCNGKNLEVRYVKSYFFKCLDCDSNTPIKHTCKTGACDVRTQKQKNHFYKVCRTCNTKELFWVNKS